jgi:hypothetical protein
VADGRARSGLGDEWIKIGGKEGTGATALSAMSGVIGDSVGALGTVVASVGAACDEGRSKGLCYDT